MRSKALIFIILLACLLFLTGCRTTLLVRDAKTDNITPILKDYVLSHGYKLTYSNDKTGSYGVDMGSVYVPYSSQTTKTTSIVAQPPSETTGQPMTAYEQTTWNTITTGGHYAQASASVRVIQDGGDVVITIDTNNVSGPSLNDLHDYIQSLGYTVENK